MSTDLLWIALGGIIGGFISGLSGFGMTIAALPIWLQALSPANAASLAAICAVFSQAQTIRMVSHAISARALAPFIIGGLAGIPVGTWLLAGIDEASFRLWTGILIVVYCTVMLSGRVSFRVGGGTPVDAAVGFAGGILGALAGLSGIPPAILASLRRWGKDERRGIFQPYNLAILAVTAVAHALAGLYTIDLARSLLVALPTVYLGTQIGKRLYHRLADHHFDRAVLAILLAAGLILAASNWLRA